ncbi:MAG: DNA-methyltransferase [Bdellovibrionales bacterium]
MESLLSLVNYDLGQLKLNTRIQMEGLSFLSCLRDNLASACFFDPQYRGVLDKMNYGNEGKKRGMQRSNLNQMSEENIRFFLEEIHRVLQPSAHLFLWIDKFHLCEGVSSWFQKGDLEVVDMITWDKGRFGMGYRTRRQCEYLLILQKAPKRAKGVWHIHNIPDVWCEKIQNKTHTHQKPLDLQSKLIEAVTQKGDLVIDPASGSFSVLESCFKTQRNFLGCDLLG